MRWLAHEIALSPKILFSFNVFIGSDCYEPGKAKEYSGKIATTVRNETCVPWNDFGHDKVVDVNNFPEKSIKDAMNYCRSPDSKTQPWCFTEKGQSRDYHDYCEVPLCGGIH